MDYFSDWLDLTVNYKKQLSMDGFGQVTFDDAEALDCYIHGTVVEVVNDKNENVVSQQQLYFEPHQPKRRSRHRLRYQND